MPPRKKLSSGDASTPNTSHAGAASELVRDLADIQAKLTAIHANHADVAQSLDDHRQGTDRLVVEIAKRLGTLETTLKAIEQHNLDHDVAAASRRASVAARLQDLEDLSKVRQDADGTLVCEDQLSQSLRTLWFAVVGVGGLVIALGIKVFAA